MKKTLLLSAIAVLSSCTSDDASSKTSDQNSNNNETSTTEIIDNEKTTPLTVEFSCDTKGIPVKILGNGIKTQEIYSFHKEVVLLKGKKFWFSASTDNSSVIVTIKVTYKVGNETKVLENSKNGDLYFEHLL